MQKTSTFFSKVYEIVSRIPKGKVSTYKDIATLAGSPNASRAVGMAMKNNANPHTIPCNRVVSSDGSMRGYSMGGVNVKMQMLQKEGVIFIGEKVDLKRSRWEPKTKQA